MYPLLEDLPHRHRPHLVIHRTPCAFHAMPGRRAAALQGTAQRDQGVRVDPAGTVRGLRSQPAEAGPTGRQDPVVDGLSTIPAGLEPW